ncbi:MAG: ABC transporter permease [Romboutsia sp.]
MKLLANIKLFIKSIKSNFFVNLIYFLGLPLVLSLVFGNIMNIVFGNPIETEVTPISIVDNDNSIESENFTKFIENDLKDLFQITPKKDSADFEVIIPNNYEESILKSNFTTIEINELKTRGDVLTLLSNIIDNYHENLYTSRLASTNIGDIFNKTSLETSYVDVDVSMDSQKYFAISMITLLAMIFITNNVAITYLGESNGLSKRIYSLPLKRTTQLIHDTIILWIYSFIFVLAYVLIHRYLKIAFTGNIFLLILICGASSLFIATCSSFITSFLSKTFANIIVTILFIAQIFFGGTFGPISDFLQKFVQISPLYLINELFTKYSNFDNFSSLSATFILCLAVSLVIFMASFVKEKYRWREF